MSIQPGVGYTFTASSQGTNFSIQTPWAPWASYPEEKTYQQFECIVVKEGSDFFLKTYKGVVDYSKSSFPTVPGGTTDGSPSPFYHIERQARITDWAIYQTGFRTAGTATDGPRFNWMADDGKVEIYNADYEGGSNQWLVTISMVDWNIDAPIPGARIINAGMPYVSVFPIGDEQMTPRVEANPKSSYSSRTMYVGASYGDSGSSVPLQIGYTYKKIAQLDWNAETNSWDVSQYEYGPIDLRINFFELIEVTSGTAPSPTAYEVAEAAGFTSVNNYAWYESMWAIPGYTQNPSNWWYHLVFNGA
jgi:hypothetical protein